MLTRNQIQVLTRLLSLAHNVQTNQLRGQDEAPAWVMNRTLGHQIAQAFASIVVNKYHKLGTNIPETMWVADKLAGISVLYSDSLPDDVIGIGALSQVGLFVEASLQDVDLLFTEESRTSKKWRRNPWGLQFVTEVDM